MINKTGILLIMSWLVVSCNTEIYPDTTNFRGTMNRIVVTKNDWSVYYVIAFKNDSDKNVILYSNSFPKSEKYETAGVIMKAPDLETPIGSFIPQDNILSIAPHSRAKFLFSYSRNNPNLWTEIDFKNAEKELSHLIQKSTFYYHYNSKVIKHNYKKSEYDPSFVFTNDFNVKKENLKIEFTDCLTLDESLALIDTKIIEVEE